MHCQATNLERSPAAAAVRYLYSQRIKQPPPKKNPKNPPSPKKNNNKKKKPSDFQKIIVLYMALLEKKNATYLINWKKKKICE